MRMVIMPAPRKYPPELRERAMRLVAEAGKEDPELSLNAAVVQVGQRVGVHADTLRGWCKPAAIDAGERPGSTPFGHRADGAIALGNGCLGRLRRAVRRPDHACLGGKTLP